MKFDLTNFRDAALDEAFLEHILESHDTDSGSAGRLWNYYRNPMLPTGSRGAPAGSSDRPYVQAQEWGLPARITGRAGNGSYAGPDQARKEVVIENDIAWRINTMVDFLFGKPLTIRSTAADPKTARLVESTIHALLEANGGLRFCREMALCGSIHGFVDIALRTPAGESGRSDTPLPARPAAVGVVSGHTDRRQGISDTDADALDRCTRAARRLVLEVIEAPRIVPILDENDFRTVRYWVQHYRKHPARMDSPSRSLRTLFRKGSPAPASVEAVEIIGPHWWQRYEDGHLTAEGPNPLARLPIVHVQNLSIPNSYAGLSDVEPLIPLQDELNTRLSDRASRVTFQAFKMYLGKGIDDFLDRPVGPGQMWATHNLNASVEEFGSDDGSPSESEHITQVRQALDKVSGVPPLAAGLIHGNLGNLTSSTALRVVLGGLLSKTARKRLTYGAGIRAVAELALDYLDRTGALRTAPAERAIDITWPDPLPAEESEQLRNAQIKQSLGVDPEALLDELGYGRGDNTQ